MEDKKMAVVAELIRKEEDGTISFGNYELTSKTKKSDFEVNGDVYKIKTFNEITKLEKNELFVYESVPGTAVENMKASGDSLEFKVTGYKDAQITVEMEPETAYRIIIDGQESGVMTTSLGGKLSFSVELDPEKTIAVQIVK